MFQNLHEITQMCLQNAEISLAAGAAPHQTPWKVHSPVLLVSRMSSITMHFLGAFVHSTVAPSALDSILDPSVVYKTRCLCFDGVLRLCSRTFPLFYSQRSKPYCGSLSTKADLLCTYTGLSRRCY